MSRPLLIAVALVYGYVAWVYFLEGRHGLALAFVAYAIANLGFALDAR